jgi:hypothetical protein
MSCSLTIAKLLYMYKAFFSLDLTYKHRIVYLMRKCTGKLH